MDKRHDTALDGLMEHQRRIGGSLVLEPWRLALPAGATATPLLQE